ncbi:poly [ADP-ribose] polymerase 14-like [Paramuricea clavata]|uniref:Poly [ADP-ribose] polymerase 14-like n=1 Tax=Paramuricea clavata TaxID=317549 RepID=A0A7D9I0I9_PARCT|nr:poly [ADP-ribose] polymerase 14-like [Paramuricea clavata]
MAETRSKSQGTSNAEFPSREDPKEGLDVPRILPSRLPRIFSLNADVLVNSTLSNLNYPTACGRALQNRGGLSYIEVCKPHTNIPPWDIVCTTGGNLSCQHVIHAVCCNWNKEDKVKSEEALRDLVMKIFGKCVELGVSSIAMPTIGAGKHGYPEDIVLKIILQEVDRISSKYVSKIALRNVSVIVFEDKQSNYSGKRGRHSSYFPSPPNMLNHKSRPQETPQQLKPQLQQALQPLSPQQATPTDTISIKPGNTANLKFGSVSIVLKEGDITKQTADAILNVLPKSLKLLDGGGVCQSILKTGSQIIQDELDQIRRDSNLGSILITSAGSIPNIKKIIHFVPTTTDVAGLQASIEQCFHSAQQHSLYHILIPAIGTANLNISPKSSADLILKAAKKFSETQNSLTVEIVVFLKKFFPDFNKAIEDQVEELATVAGSQHGQQNSGNTETQAVNNEVNNNSFTINVDSQDADNSNAAGTVEEIQLHFIGFKKNIDDAISETKVFVDRNKDERSVENIGDIFQKHKSEVDKLSRIYRVRIKSSSAGHLAVQGMKSDVQEFLVQFTEIRRKYEIDQRSWSDNLPSFWDEQPMGKSFHLATLLSSSSEYKEILTHFKNAFAVGTPPKVTKIERIQNPKMFELYQAKKKSMEGRENEMRLFHGTDVKNTVPINTNNFNRSYSGINVEH